MQLEITVAFSAYPQGELMKQVSIFAIMMTLWLGSGPASAVDSGTSQSIRQGAPKGITEAFYACVDKAGGM